MRRFATRRLSGLAALALLAAPAVQAQTAASRQITTTTLVSTVYNNGNIGGDCAGTIPAFRFNTDEGLCGAGFLVGLSETSVVGDAYILNATTGWTPVSIGASTAFPYPAFQSGTRAVFRNAAQGFEVELNAYTSATQTDVIVYRYAITNTGAAARPAVHTGLFHDWDVGGAAYATNVAAVDQANGLLIAWDPTLASPNYFGTAVLDAPLTGWSYDTNYPAAAGQLQSRAELWAGLTQTQGLTSAGRDQRGVIGTGPFAIGAGETVVRTFALAAGTTLANLSATVAAARGAIVSSDGGAEARGFALSPARPNPASGVARMSVTLPEASDVRVTAFDALGRQVAVLAEGLRPAGTSDVAFDTAALPSGVYVVRMETAGEVLSRRVSVVR